MACGLQMTLRMVMAAYTGRNPFFWLALFGIWQLRKHCLYAAVRAASIACSHGSLTFSVRHAPR